MKRNENEDITLWKEMQKETLYDEKKSDGKHLLLKKKENCIMKIFEEENNILWQKWKGTGCIMKIK